MLRTVKLDEFSQCSHFSTSCGADEFFIAIRSAHGSSPAEALVQLTEHYESVLNHCHLDGDTTAFSRIFLSDGANQNALLAASPLSGLLKKGALSVIGQKPLFNGPISLFSYHIRSGNGSLRKTTGGSLDNEGTSALISGEHYSLLLTAGFMGERSSDAYAQSTELFTRYGARIGAEGMTLPDNVLRTWIFLRDVDCDYGDMVRARRELFDRQGLSDKTRYLASTGIEGRMTDCGNLVSLDAIAMGGLSGKQIIRVEAPTHLSPTIAYGVTFERGLAVRFGDRSHLYISGTASINNKGEVLHIGNAEKQARRTLENIRALCATQKADLTDMAYFIAYARNFHDREAIARVLNDEIDADVPLVFVEAPVCRPAWLVELEGMAVLPCQSDFPPFL
jgi:enamine deaminase RidA (YjgF/YER057c/UK114 family)